MTDTPLAAPPVGAPIATPPEVAPDELDREARRRRRRRLALLILLGTLAMLLLLIGGWYAIFRKPLDQILPPVVIDKTPAFSFSIYGIDRPIGVAVTPDGSRIYVADTAGERVVHVYDNKGKEVGQLSPPGTTPAARIPVYIAIDPLSGEVYVTDRQSHAIEVYRADGTFDRTYKPDPAVGDWAPLGIVFDPAGHLYVSDVGGAKHSIFIFDRDGTLMGTRGASAGLNYPNGLALDARGDLFVADGNNGRVVVIDPSDRVIGTVARGTGPGELGLPRGTAIDTGGLLYVADTSAHVIEMYRIDATTGAPSFVATLGQEGRGPNAFEYPNGVAVDSRSRLYIADWANDRLDVWSY